MVRLMLAGAAVAAATVALPQLASASEIVFTNGIGNFAGSQTTTGTFTDTFTFTLDSAETASGSVSTRLLRDIGGNTVSDLDFLGVSLNGVAFTPGDNTDADEAFFLPTTLLGTGLQTLAVSYRVDTASSANAAGYSGTLNIAPAAGVPEPATWAMLLTGFGLVGIGARRRAKVSFAQAV